MAIRGVRDTERISRTVAGKMVFVDDVLRHIADATEGNVADNATRLRSQQPQHEFDQRSLARSIWTDDGDNIFLINGKRYVLDNNSLFVGKGEAVDVYQRVAGGSPAAITVPTAASPPITVALSIAVGPPAATVTVLAAVCSARHRGRRGRNAPSGPRACALVSEGRWRYRHCSAALKLRILSSISAR